MKMLSLFSGIGAPETALKRIGVNVELVGFSEIDKFAVKSYCAIHEVDESLNLGDITKIEIEKLPKDIEIITHGSPCQDFSIAGKEKGGDIGTGTRSSLMWNTVAICEHCLPKYVIWENVKNILNKKHIHNFEKYLREMERIGYKNFYKVLNAKDYGIPQNRERLFVISIRNDINKTYEFPKGFKCCLKLKDLLEKDVNEKYYLSEKMLAYFEKHKNKHQLLGNGFGYKPKNTDIDTIANTIANPGRNQQSDNYIIECIDANGRTDENTINTLTSTYYKGVENYGTRPFVLEGLNHYLRIRKLTPLECFKFMGFNFELFKRAEKVCSDTQLYKQAGNSIVVDVLERIFKNLF